MKIAIHNTPGSFSERWISYCNENMIDYKVVNCYHTDIIRQLSDCDALMWHFNHKSPKAVKFAKQLLWSLEISGKQVFPDYKTSWHFDDKLGQKYLLELIGAPIPETYVFYEKSDALKWAEGTDYPKVFKLRTGAGSDNVKLVESRRNAARLIEKAFSKGFKQYRAWSNLKERYRKYRIGKGSLPDVLKGLIRLVYTTEYSKLAGREAGYIYFQDFIPDNDSDIRVVVIGSRAFAIKRMVRKNDFRASGSGYIQYAQNLFDPMTIKLSFDIAAKLDTQCIAFDFVYKNREPLLVEISYGFSPEGYDPCPGFWDKDMNWHEGKFNPYGWMVEGLISRIGR